VNISRAIRNLRLDADEATGHMSAIEDPIDRVTSEDGGNLLLDWEQDERRLQEAGPNHSGGCRFGDRDRARSARLKVMRFRGGDGGRAEGKSTGDEDENRWLHNESFRFRVELLSDRLTLGKPGDTFGESVLFDQLRPPDSILWLGRKRCVAVHAIARMITSA
jgi:hypothetical protein